MDGSLLVDKYLKKGYKVVGVDTWEPTSSYPNLSGAMLDKNFVFETGDVCERYWIESLLDKHNPDIIYHMAAVSLVPESFKNPHKVFEINTLATLNFLEILRYKHPTTKFYFAATSEMIGSNAELPQNNDSKMLPSSPYGISKLASYHLVRMYRIAYGLFAVNGLLFNHEGPRRGPKFVTRKITKLVSKYGTREFEPLHMGNLDAMRDWGSAHDYTDAMIMMMEVPEPDDYTVATGETHTVREFIEEAFSHVHTSIRWEGTGEDEKGYDDKGEVVVDINKELYRPYEVPYLHGDYSKINRILGWKPTTTFKGLVSDMMDNDLKEFYYNYEAQ
jgi:GDPmannose 4,6-dehydratase